MEKEKKVRKDRAIVRKDRATFKPRFKLNTLIINCQAVL